MDPLNCPRCDTALRYLGMMKLHEGSRMASLVGELFVNREKFDVYVCPRCGRVEWFIEGVGEEFRKEQ